MSVYLILSIVFSTLFACCYKVAAYRRCNLSAVNVWLYVGGFTVTLAFVLIGKRFDFNMQALLLGVVAGVFVFIATLSFFHHMSEGQLSVSWTVISLAVGFPVIASIFFWHEHPTSRQTVGLLLMVVALILFGRQETGGKGDKP